MKTYEHGEDKPSFEKRGSGTGHQVEMKCCADFKSDSADQAFGQSGKHGLMSDEKKISSQFFHAYTDDVGY